MTHGYGLGENWKFEVGQRLNYPIGEDFRPCATIVAAVLPWKGNPEALLLYYREFTGVPDLPSVTTAKHARDWWLPGSTLEIC